MIIPKRTGQNDRMIDSEPIRRRKLSHEILDRLLARITQGELAAGDHLPSERDLMSQYGVGRPAVREAMQALERWASSPSPTASGHGSWRRPRGP